MAAVKDKYAEFRGGEEDALTRLAKMAKSQLEQQQQVARMETALKTAKAVLTVTAEEEIPALMAEVGMKEFTTTDGFKITLKEDIKAKIPKAKLNAACTWIERRGEGEIIKRLFVIGFGTGDGKWANKFERDLARRKKPLKVERTKGIHNQTLLAYLRSLRSKGVNVPMAMFGAFEYTVAKVIAPK